VGLQDRLAQRAGCPIAASAGSGTSPARPGDGRRLPLHLLVEDVLGLRLGQGAPVGYGFDRRVLLHGRHHDVGEGLSGSRLSFCP